jgi:hypothetical protein
MVTCSECPSKHYGRGVCYYHYLRLPDVRERRRIQSNEYYKKRGRDSFRQNEKTRKGFLMRLYRNMQSRVTGVQKVKFHLYQGKALLPRQEFYSWALPNRTFDRLFKAWERSKYDRKLTPSVDRIDPRLGYEIENMRWLTHSENSRLGALR